MPKRWGIFGRLRTVSDDPTIIYNTGMIYNKMGQPANAVAAMREFLNATKAMRGHKWQELRGSAEALCKFLVVPGPPENKRRRPRPPRRLPVRRLTGPPDAGLIT